MRWRAAGSAEGCQDAGGVGGGDGLAGGSGTASGLKISTPGAHPLRMR